MSARVEKIAKVTRAYLGIEDHGLLTATLTLDYGDSAQGTPAYALDAWDESLNRRVGTASGLDFITGLMGACGVVEWSQVEGRTVFAIFESDAFHAPMVGLKPLPTEPGKAFMFDAWSADAKAEEGIA